MPKLSYNCLLPAFFAVFCHLSSTWAEPPAVSKKFPTFENYESGKSLCGSLAQSKENRAAWISVPVDYKDLSKGRFELYYFLEETFDPLKKSIIHFTGGPGIRHEGRFPGIATKEYNIIYFDQRGIGCSRPESFTVFWDPDFYSSENTARDANEIRRILKIDQVSLYGSSYGTVPPLIFAKLFPQHTRSLILEGVINDAGHIWGSQDFWRLFQSWLNGLPQEDIRFINQLPSLGFPGTWLTTEARSMFYQNNPLALWNQFFIRLKMDPKSYLPSENNFYNPNFFFPFMHIDNTAHYVLGCRELAKSDPHLQTDYTIQNNRLVPAGNSDLQFCDYLNIPYDPKKVFKADQYQTSRPVTYFQGLMDAATVVSGALQNYKNVPLGFKQFFLKKNGGHAPLGEMMMDSPELYLKILHAAVEGQPLDQDTFEQLSNSSKWNYMHSK